MPDPIVQLEGITKRYDGTEADVLAGINLTVCPGDSIAIIGPSGCGKSTLLNIIGTLDAPTAGTVKLDGSDLYAMSETKLAEVRNKRFGFVFQDHHLLPQCTAIENVLIPTLAGFTGAADAEPRAVALLNCPADKDNAWRSSGPWSISPTCCLSMSPPGRSMIMPRRGSWTCWSS